MKSIGNGQVPVLQPSEIKSGDSARESSSAAIAVSGWQMVRELLQGPMESDEALQMRIVFLCEIVDEVGAERFIEAVKQAIRISEFRSQVSIGRIRRLCGLDVTEPTTPAVQAWHLVTTVATRFVRRDVNGNAVLEPRVTLDDNRQGIVEPVPDIPDAVAKAVQDMGGWGALQDSFPAWWAQRFQLFKELYRP
jgi:hypothetical protein